MATYNDIFRTALGGDEEGLKSAVDNALVDKIRDKLINKTLEVSSSLLQNGEEEMDINSAQED
mgnify:FL=1|tara:strand:+ start:3868 stop:4056 length:189 start_codon:yes stop_codon:yes gene_type:complete